MSVHDMLEFVQSERRRVCAGWNMAKTNAQRMLEYAGIPYDTVEYEVDEDDLSGVHAAEVSGIDPDMMFKTLVGKNERGEFLVFCIPVAEELDLKKCAKAAKCKSVALIHVKELLPVTGYIRGGCSPVGMKKKFPTYVDETAELFDEIYVSAGMRGQQMKVPSAELLRYLEADISDLTARHTS